jgi:PAS domain S-box-containing protein
MVRKDGSVFDGHVRISAPDPLDRTKGTIAAFSDVSKLRDAERALAESERRYRTLVESVPDVIFSLDSEGRFTFVNSQVEKFLGYTVTGMLGTPLWDYAEPEYHGLAESVVQVPSYEIWDEELGVLDSQGGRKWVRIRCQPSCDENGRRVGFEGLMMDRTVRRQLEEELRASQEELQAKMKIIDDLYAHMVQSEKAKAIAEHTAEVAHELRQPLAIIGGFTRRMEHQLEAGRNIDISRQKESFQIITREVKRLEEILGGLIDFSRREAIQLVSVNPHTLIEEVLRIHEERFREKDLHIETHFGQDVGEVYLDPKRFQQVVRNLVSNAIEASYQDGIVSVHTGVFTPGDKAQKTGELEAEQYFELKVENGGRIIPPEELHRLFEPFYTTKEYGVGMGLTLSKKIIEDHHGSISVKSDQDGTVFTVWVPLQPVVLNSTSNRQFW